MFNFSQFQEVFWTFSKCSHIWENDLKFIKYINILQKNVLKFKNIHFLTVNKKFILENQNRNPKKTEGNRKKQNKEPRASARSLQCVA